MTQHVIVLNYFRPGIEHRFSVVQYATDQEERVDEWLQHTAESRMCYLKLPMIGVFREISEEERKNLDTLREDYYEIIQF